MVYRDASKIPVEVAVSGRTEEWAELVYWYKESQDRKSEKWLSFQEMRRSIVHHASNKSFNIENEWTFALQTKEMADKLVEVAGEHAEAKRKSEDIHAELTQLEEEVGL